MSNAPRLNGMIAAIESGRPAFSTFSPIGDIEGAVALSQSPFDGVIFEGEHNGWDIRGLRDCLQYSLNRGQIARSASDLRRPLTVT